jgi:uncharacterized protein
LRIAIIGTGIAGNSAAYALHPHHDITVYEKAPRLGGHSATVRIETPEGERFVDTGFIVYNTLNYPNFTKLLDTLNVPTQPSTMSFALSNPKSEWAGHSAGFLQIINGLFARRRNLFSITHLKMLRDILRFNALAARDAETGGFDQQTLNNYLTEHRFSPAFIKSYIIPMGAAIWSMSEKDMLGFPAQSFLNFFNNHRLIHWQRPQWRTITGGSQNYVAALTASFKDKIRLGCGVTHVQRFKDHVEVTDAGGETQHYDHVIFATHTDEALTLLPNASDTERDILGAIRYKSQDVYLHSDTRLMSKRRAAWAAWNVLQIGDDERLTLTYWMNALQSLQESPPLFVTLNPFTAPEHVYGHYRYSHPQYTREAVAAQKMLPRIQGVNRTWFCGAWASAGFHEDGLVSGWRVAEALGADVPWAEMASGDHF